MKALGLVDDVRTKINGAQAEGCSPISTAFKAGRDFFKPVKPKTIAKSLAIGNPADGYYALKATAESKGAMDMVSDDEVVEGIKLLGQTEGIFAETAGGVTIGVLKKLVKQGTIKKRRDGRLYHRQRLKDAGSRRSMRWQAHRIHPSLASFEKTFKMGKNGGGDA
jgi:threonine synthase